MKATKLPKSAAKKKECVNPRCPQNESYGIPKLNPKTSASGAIEQRMPRIQNFGFLSSSEKVLPNARAAKLCPNIDATSLKT